jgi:hypothetical protein
MIIFFRDGRLGNQLFQYSCFRKYFPNHKLVFFGLPELFKTFDNILGTFFFLDIKTYNYIHRILLIQKFFSFLAKIRIIGQISELNKNKKYKLIIRNGILFNVYLAKYVYFQNQECQKEFNAIPIIKKKFLNQAKSWFKNKRVLFDPSRLIFVHIRRGDYISFPSVKYPAALDLIWYKKAMVYMGQKIRKPIFIVMSDDPKYIYDEFKESGALIISNNSAEIDLAIMSMCSHGILSPSTFSWWGAFLSKSNKFNKISSYFIAPKFWAGHRAKKWIPKNLFSKWITYLE